MTTNLPAVVPQVSMSPGQVLASIVEKGVTSDNAEAMIRLTTFVREEESKRSFAAAFAAFQAECPKVVAETPIPDKLGNVRFRYAGLDSILEVVAPILARHGLGYSFTQGPAQEMGRITAICTLSHTDGYSKSGEATIRAGSGPSGASESQADSAALTMAQRRAFCNVCGIVVRKGADARDEGDVISATEAADLQQRVFDACTVNGRLDEEQVKRYLKFGGATTWSGIRRVRYEQLVQLPALRRSGGAASAPPAAAPSQSATPAKPFQASFDDAGAWRSAMIAEIAQRWNCTTTAAAIFSEMEKASGKSYLSMTAEGRRAAWEKLTSGGLDRRFAPKKS